MNVALILNDKGRNVVSASADTSLLDITKKLTEHRIGCIVIVDANKHVCGIVSERDIVRTIAKNGTHVLNEPVSTCMTKKVLTCQEADTIDWIMSEMSSHRFRHMPVVENAALIGLVSIGDVVRARIAEAEMEAAALRDYIATG